MKEGIKYFLIIFFSGLIVLLVGVLGFLYIENNKDKNNLTSSSPQQSNNKVDNIDYDCEDFSTHEEAQDYFESQGGSSSNNVDRLDRDGDGIACEALP